MLGRFIVAAGGAEHADFGVLAEIETDGADQIADVFDEEQIQRLDIDAIHGLHDVMGFEMAAFAGVDLDDAIGEAGDAVGVALGGEIADDDADTQACGRDAKGGFDEGGLAAAGRAHQIDRENAGSAQTACDSCAANLVVELQNVLDNLRLA